MNNINYIKNVNSRFLKITGEDRKSFLQALITNDINACKYNNSIYSCLLSPQGKFLADFFITNIDNYFLIEINDNLYEDFVNKLKIYKLRSKVEIIEINFLFSYVIFVNEIPKIKNFVALFEDPRNKKIGFKVYFENKQNEQTSLIDFNQIGEDYYEELLIKNLIPNSVNDLIKNKSLLLENNFQNLNAIDWDKGCYVGQEITARMQYRALLKKKLYNLELVSGEIKVGNEIFFDNLKIGEVVSKKNNYMLCMFRINLADELKNKKENFKINLNVILKFL